MNCYDNGVTLINRLFRAFSRRIIYFFFIPLLRSLGYRAKSLNLGLPESMYFKGQDSLRSVRRIHQEYLSHTGWLESKNANQAIRNGKYLPWTSYAFTHWFETKDVSDQTLLEFGSGASTLFWADHFRKVDSVESDKLWLERVQILVSNIPNITLHPLKGGNNSKDIIADSQSAFHEVYEKDRSLFPEISNEFWEIDFDALKKIVGNADWIFIDGGPRNFYCEFSLSYARKDTIFVLDNADEDYTLIARNSLIKYGYIEVPFHSLGPLNPFSWTTSVFVSSLEQLKK